MSKQDEASSNRSVKKPLIIALGAIFLLTGVSISLKASPGSSDIEVNTLLAGQGVPSGGASLAQIRSDQAAALEAPELVLLSETSLVAVSPIMTIGASVLGAIIGDSTVDIRSRQEILYYIVEEGDTVATLAERFEVSSDTILWANDLENTSTLKLGQELIILPVSGALHLVRPSDTLSEIALWYKGDIEEILRFNGIDNAEDIFVGDLLVIAGGRKPANLPNGRLTPLANSYFIYPTPRAYRLTQGLHPYNAVDLSNDTCGGPAYAAAGGIVQQVGYHGVAGSFVRVLHPNGVVTFYGHLSGQAVSPGERVLQGQIVGYIGHSGHTIPAGPAGCHLHFEVRGATNPFAK